jgi:NAD(P)-dependent dehydrogenase (short-subunit alcohol dehydrogenase family)
MKSAIVTGATSGIGRAAAVALSRAGYWVLAGGRDEARGKEVLVELEDGPGGHFLAADLSVDGIPEQLVSTAVEATGRLDALVNSAGVHFLATVEQTTPQRFDELMAVNLRAAVMLCRAAIPAMRESGGGVIVNVSSEAGLVAVPEQVAYNVSKAALVMLTKSIAADHSTDNIRAVTICPGTTLTQLVEDAITSAPDPDEHARWLASSRPAKRLGDPEEIAKGIVFSIEGGADYMTGSEIVIDGGYTAI